MTTKQIKEFREASDNGSLADDRNPIFTFSSTSVEVLVMIAKGEIDPIEMVYVELRNRGLSSEGQFIGFKESEQMTRKPTISIEWSVSDVMELWEQGDHEDDLTIDDALTILQFVADNHDASLGVNCETITDASITYMNEIKNS